MKRLFAISLFTCFISVNFAYADGMYVSDHYTHLYEPSQKAAISRNGKRQTMILSAAVKSGDLYDTAIALRRGMATPLKFEFESRQPFYPLHISSLNRGKSLIEVYVISSAPMKDDNQMLRVDEAKKIDPDLRRKLARHIDMANAEYVTRLSYRGALRKLSADAVFKEKDATLSRQ